MRKRISVTVRKTQRVKRLAAALMATICCVAWISCGASPPAGNTARSYRSLGGTERRAVKPRGEMTLHKRKPDGTARRVTPPETLRESDHFALSLRMDAPAHVYLFHSDAAGAVSRLFPNPKYSPVANPLSPGSARRIPEGRRWFVLDHHKGWERFVLLAYPTALPNPEAVFHQVKPAPKRSIGGTRPRPAPAVDPNLLFVQVLEMARE